MIKINKKNINVNASGAKIALLSIFEIMVFGAFVTNENTIPVAIAPSDIALLFAVSMVFSSGIVMKSDANDM